MIPHPECLNHAMLVLDIFPRKQAYSQGCTIGRLDSWTPYLARPTLQRNLRLHIQCFTVEFTRAKLNPGFFKLRRNKNAVHLKKRVTCMLFALCCGFKRLGL